MTSVLPICLLCVLNPVFAHALPAPSGTARLILDGNRIYADVEFVRPDGTARKTLVFVDLGSPSMVLSEELYKELHSGLRKSLTFRLGAMTVAVESSTVTPDSWLPFSIGGGRKVEGVLPAGVMQKYQVRFDYARRTITLAQPGTLGPEGAAVPFRVNEKTGLIAIEASIGGETYPLTIDNGSGYTWIRKSAASAWLSRHPEWQRGSGAVGPSNMRMADDGIETAGVLLRIPEIMLGSVIGWLGGNVLRAFRITIDYPRHLTYWVRQGRIDPHDLDYIGLTLVSRQGDYFVGSIVTQEGKPTVAGVQAGDKLVQIGALGTHLASRRAIFAAMHGKPGEVRALILERDGARIERQAKVTAF